MNLNKFNVAYIKMCTEIEGPFKRCCIWFQGCNLNCKDCCNKNLQPLIPNYIIKLDRLIDIVKEAKEKYNIEGITLTGGEPSLQKGLITFNKAIHELGLGIIMFSGIYKQNINKQLVESIDLLIDGPFITSNIDNERILIGSKNKHLSFITDRYIKEESYFQNTKAIEEVNIEDNYIFINGD